MGLRSVSLITLKVDKASGVVGMPVTKMNNVNKVVELCHARE